MSAAIRAALLTFEPRAKVMAARKVAREWRLGRLAFDFDVAMPHEPARPLAPELLPPNCMPKRGKAGSERGRVALWHAVAHIEFVAIDLALDMAGRFGAEMGAEFVSDFLAVAAEEAMHFALIDRHLASMGSFYGALPAHAGLWEAADETRHDVAARLAVVPMVLEARGLDVTPAMLDRVKASGDKIGARLLNRILDDEIRHVRTGVKHFVTCAENSGHAPDSLWKSLVQRHFHGQIKKPFNDSARRSAGLPLEWVSGLVPLRTSVITQPREAAGGIRPSPT
ncbi:ferritin-like domain-containing protein [Novosphingobium sp. 9U]|uniref:ferritin-like domain-containing protein n=1 Tax=Novosphingobium sp. 9U TaxID=2653158 RepID=UPI0012F3E44C|nr:ferritin-like domain-containing protein [Novosphingobium sp. 9U]VWX53622.1 putative exported protein [Novosphingobium sp. 9U]